MPGVIKSCAQCGHVRACYKDVFAGEWRCIDCYSEPRFDIQLMKPSVFVILRFVLGKFVISIELSGRWWPRMRAIPSDEVSARFRRWLFMVREQPPMVRLHKIDKPHQGTIVGTWDS